LKIAPFDRAHTRISPMFLASLSRVPGQSSGVVCVILGLAVLVVHRLVTDGRTSDGHTMTA